MNIYVLRHFDKRFQGLFSERWCYGLYLFGIADETFPLLRGGDLGDELSAEISLQTSLAKRGGAFVAKDQLTAFGTPPGKRKITPL